jgi:predicted Rossmann fold flavoprotein
MIYDLIVVGGGASGMIAAGRAAERGKKVLLLEKNIELGEKLKITGNGRCNITNTTPDLGVLLKNYGQAEKFLYSSFVKFGVEETINFFAKLGLPIKTEKYNRAFPESEQAADVVAVLINYLKQNKVTIKTNAKVSGFEVKGDTIVSVKVGSQTYAAKNFVLATGGSSHPETGSTGDGFKWLKSLGCEVVAPTPAVVPISVKEKWIKKLSGVSFDEIKISFLVDNKKIFFKKGRVLCTHFGLSGPLILNCSSRIADLLPTGEVVASIDLFPNLDHGALDRHVIELINNNPKCNFSTILRYLLPAGTANELTKILAVNAEQKANTISKAQRSQLVQKLKDLRLTVTGLMGLDKAVVVDGGLLLKEVDNKTFKLNKFANLYATGDILHIRRPSGGFSLQLCWTSGYVVGESI